MTDQPEPLPTVPESAPPYWCGHEAHVPGDCPWSAPRPVPETAAPSEPRVGPRFDECECGDYRHQHEEDFGRCLICRWARQGWPPCRAFKLSRVAPPAEPVEEAQRYWCGHSEHVPGDCPTPPMEVEDEGARPLATLEGATERLAVWVFRACTGGDFYKDITETQRGYWRSQARPHAAAIREEATAATRAEMQVHHDKTKVLLWEQVDEKFKERTRAEEAEQRERDLFQNLTDTRLARAADEVSIRLLTARAEAAEAKVQELAEQPIEWEHRYWTLHDQLEAAEGELREHPLIKAAARLREAEATLAPAIERAEGSVHARNVISQAVGDLMEAARALTGGGS